jgi:NAD(P)-dependent dehydrogenase (short-subunit alcohol dehydrogenase family)
VDASFAKIKEDLGNVNVLVYNAGGGGFGIKPLDINPDAFRKSFETSCLGALLCSQAVLPDMLAASGGRSDKKGMLLFSSATSAFRGGANTAQFACGKFALRALSQSLAKAYASEGIHACHVRLDCILATPSYQEKHKEMFDAGKMADTDAVAETYYQLHLQSMLALSNEIDIRPNQEGWSY